MTKILNQKNYHVLPFIFERDLESIRQEIKEKTDGKDKKEQKKEKWNLKDNSGAHLYVYIKDLITSKDNIGSRIGIELELNINSSDCTEFGIYINNNAYKNIRTAKENYLFKYDFIKLYLFETGVGFLVYSINFGIKENVNIDDIINGNYYFKKFDQKGIQEDYSWEIEQLKEKIKEIDRNIEGLKSENSSEEILEKYKLRKDKNIEKIKCFEKITSENLRKVYVEKLLKDLNLGVKNYFTSDKGPNYAHLFSYVNFDTNVNEGDINKYIYWLKNSYKKTYKPPFKELINQDKKEYLRLFDNIWWGSSVEGLTCITKNTYDEVANEFIKSYSGNIEHVYLYMYILTLHMRYALLRYIIDASYLPKDIENYNEEEIKILNKLKQKIILLDLRSIFNDISNMSSQIKVFDLIRESLRIDKLNYELTNEINNLDELAKLYYNNQSKIQKEIEKKEKEKEKEKQEQVDKMLQIITFMLTIVATSSVIKEMINSVINIGDYENKIYLSMMIFIIIPIIILCIIYLIKISINMKKNNKGSIK